jgi:hypothetical protein
MERQKDMKLNLIKVAVFMFFLSVMASCASFEGDGKFEKTTNWLLFYPAHEYRLTFDPFDFSKRTTSYSFENMCHNNNSFILYLRLTAAEDREWWNDPGRVKVILQNKEGTIVFEDVYQFNSWTQSTRRGYVSEYSDESYSNIRKHIPTKDMVLSFQVRHSLGCEKYRLTLLLDQPYPVGQISGEVRLVSSWK